MSPLVPILLPLVLTAIVLSVLFARVFPPAPEGQVAPLARFGDATSESGLTFVHHQGGADWPTTLGGAVVVIDYNRDGHPDLFFVNGTLWPWEHPEDFPHRATSALFHNDGTGRFTDVSAAAGLDLELQGITAAVGDFDRDGWPDLYVTAVGGNRLLRNRGDGRFEDVTAQAGVGGDAHTWSSGAAWIDFDGDGWLDLVVCEYARWPREIDLELAFKIAGVGRSYGAPAGFVPAPLSLYRNLGDGTFAEAGEAAGLVSLDVQTGLPRALPLAVLPLDSDGDGWLDLLISHQGGDEVLFVNQGNGTFREWTGAGDRRWEGAGAGLAATAAFPLAPDVSATDRFALWRAVASLDVSEPAEGGLPVARKLGFVGFDYELDGRKAVLLNPSLIEPEINRFDHGRDFGRAPQLWVQRGSRWLPAPPAEEPIPWPPQRLPRGLAAADFDGDGGLDFVWVEHNGPARLWRNEQRSNMPWLRVELLATRSAPGAGGARVEVHTPRVIHVQSAAPAMGLLSQSESVLTFGLAEDARVRRIVVTWPGGQRQEIRPAVGTTRLTIEEP
jgi:enediyne biosynthesis protein E4